ncbi:MAG TPA: hypothetical protein VHU82_12175 [Vicinamibacterales bacterium]|jgi:hypothetical protein|nr:hypothetical protein [Vicinamibacterales bacterium]
MMPFRPLVGLLRIRQAAAADVTHADLDADLNSAAVAPRGPAFMDDVVIIDSSGLCYYRCPYMATEVEVLAARLARIKAMVDTLERISAGSAEQQDIFLKLKAELSAARETVTIADKDPTAGVNS